jgi:hypothetical protein
MSLPDIVLLEIFTYLSCEDVLYVFGDLLTEHGAFRRICLSSQLPRRQYIVLSNDIWRYNLIYSFVRKEMFSDFIKDVTPCQIFPFFDRVTNTLFALFIRMYRTFLDT